MKTRKILLVDVDSKYPNIALMKLSTYFKSQGYVVELRKLHYDYFNQKRKSQRRRTVINAKGYEKVFLSIIFTANCHKVFVINCHEVEYGGTGRDLITKLPKEIDDCIEDYSIYDEQETSYGFITRGCIRNCSFCFVPKKEGMIYKYRDIEKIIKFKRTRFFDNNILAYPGWKEEIQKLIDLQWPCAFSQGLDIRCLDEEKANMIRQMNYISEYYFAFDDIALMPVMEEKIKIIEKCFPPWSCRFYIYHNASMDMEKDVLARINFLRGHKCLVYLMRDINCLEGPNKKMYQKLAQWCYKPSIFIKCRFEDFKI